MYNIVQMREEVAKAYPGTKWAQKVWSMPDNQVMAIYFRLRQCGRIGA